MTTKTEKTTILIHYGELGLKGKNRIDFENRLRKNIKASCTAKKIDCDFSLEHRYLTLAPHNPKLTAETLDILSKTFGISWYAPATVLPITATSGDITAAVVQLAQTFGSPDRTFRIKAKRANKNYPERSAEIEKSVGKAVIADTSYTRVNLSRPDDTYYIEIDQQEIYIFNQRYEGLRGLPVGSSGPVLVLLSGGFDSPVAAYLMAKRGCSVNFLHFYVNKPRAGDKISRLAGALTQYTGPGTLHTAPYLPFNIAVLDIGTEYELVLFRRFMLKIAERICSEKGYQAIVSGDSLGQVASQTLENISATTCALADTTLLRPLIAYDKEEIIALAKRIGTYDISNESDKDCCSLIDRHAKTRVSREKIEMEEEKIENYEKVCEETLLEGRTL